MQSRKTPEAFKRMDKLDKNIIQQELMKIAASLHYHYEWEDQLDPLINTGFSAIMSGDEQFVIRDPLKNSDPEIAETYKL